MVALPRQLIICTVFWGGYIVLQIIYFTTIWTLRNKVPLNESDLLKVYQSFYERLNKEASIDKSGGYKVLLTKQIESEAFELALLSQCSFNHIGKIAVLLQFWNGPISVAVYTEAQYLDKTVWDLSKLVVCSKRDNLYLQVVVPFQKLFVPTLQESNDLNEESECEIPFENLMMKNFNWSTPYPINLLRNTAKRGTLAPYILTIDIDMVPSIDLYSFFISYLLQESGLETFKDIYVVPAFEVPEDKMLPLSKKDLIDSIKSKIARPFYLIPCRKCHKKTGYLEWIKATDAKVTTPLFEREWEHPWEPFFISKRNAPDYDERFKQYGMNRVSQICEMYVKGYRFFIMSNVFLIHRGYKTGEDFHKTKDSEMEANRILYREFYQEMKKKYPKSKRECKIP